MSERATHRLVLATTVMLLATPPSTTASRTIVPALGKTVVVARVSGSVLVTLPRASRPTPVTRRTVIPVGSTIDVTKGVVNLAAARDTHGRQQNGALDGAAFIVTQKRSGLVDLQLTGGRPVVAVCGSTGKTVRARATRAPGKRVLRALHARVHGSFRVTGEFAAATVRGTDFTVADQCNATSIHANRGSVDTVSRDHQLTRLVLSGETDQYRCSFLGAHRRSNGYCLELDVVNDRDLGSTIYPGLSTSRKEKKYDVCITSPAGRTSCSTWAFTHPFFAAGRPYPLGAWDLLACDARRPGNYQVSWRLHGVTLGAPLTAHATIPAFLSQPCSGFIGNNDITGLSASLPADVKAVTRLSVPIAVALDGVAVYLSPTGLAGTERIRGVMYADRAGAPGALLAATGVDTVTTNQPARFHVMSFPAQPHQHCVVAGSLPSFCRRIAAGAYWIGLISGGDSNVAAIRYDSVPGFGAYNVNSFVAGPSDPFGPPSVDNAYLVVQATYTTSAGLL